MTVRDVLGPDPGPGSQGLGNQAGPGFQGPERRVRNSGLGARAGIFPGKVVRRRNLCLPVRYQENTRRPYTRVPAPELKETWDRVGGYLGLAVQWDEKWELWKRIELSLEMLWPLRALKAHTEAWKLIRDFCAQQTIHRGNVGGASDSGGVTESRQETTQRLSQDPAQYNQVTAKDQELKAAVQRMVAQASKDVRSMVDRQFSAAPAPDRPPDLVQGRHETGYRGPWSPDEVLL